MQISNFLIAAISTAAIAKPLPDAQTNTPSGYFPSNFGAEEFYNLNKQWAPTVNQRPDNGNTFPNSNNPSPIPQGPQIGDPSLVKGGPGNGDSSYDEGDLDNGKPSLVPNAPAESDPRNYHTTTEHPPGISPAFRYFREFWCGAFEGREQSVCCLGNEYGAFRPFEGGLPCEKKQWVLGAGTETIGLFDTRFLRYCHAPSYLYSCDGYYNLYRRVQCYSDCPSIDALP